jgi:2-polyprenyl-3-methyl-5-hydroxy-6-metoxy-1,4-benzoquinol methylase
MVNSYDDLWRTVWGDLQQFGPVHRHIREDLVRLVASLDVATILDVGCGSGANLALLAVSGRYALTGMDVSSEALSMARRQVSTARFHLGDVSTDPLPERFDLVISVQVLEHIADDISALRNMAQMARRHVFVSTMQGRMRRSEVSIGHLRNYSPVELRRKMELAGLHVVRMYGWGFPFYSPLYRSAIEWLPMAPSTGALGPVSRTAARFLYHLYRLNWPGRGDVISVLAQPHR